MIDLKKDQLDSLTELINIGVGRAAKALNDLTESHIILRVPRIEIYNYTELDKIAERFGQGPVAAVLQGFHGKYTGRAALIFPPEAALNLVIGITGEEPEATDLDAIQSGTLSEVGNIVINALIGTIGNLLQNRLDFDLSEYKRDVISNLFTDSKYHSEQSFVLLSEVHFLIKKMDISGHILLSFDIESLDTLFDLIEQRF